MDKNSDTFDRSCDHWSESRRGEMEGFYALASLDYQHLAEAIDWKNWLETKQKKVGSRCLRLLDVACGAGKFPVALTSYAGVTSSTIRPIDYALLDPSSFSISEARKALVSPFRAGVEYEMKVQELECLPGSFDIVWATHALYAVPHNELEIALNRMLYAMGGGGEAKNEGVGFIAHASSKSHYLEFYRHYLSGFKKGEGAQYTSSEQIITMLEKIGVALEIKEISYINMAPKSKEGMVEKYLQRCLFDDTISLKDMLSNPVTGPYLEKCRKNGMWNFAQSVSLIFIADPASSAIE
jgi:ubiquinone/menaquinone biosynthesis C-methylase UbiE